MKSDKPIGHPILNPQNHKIYITLGAVIFLDKNKFLRRDRQTGLKKISQCNHDVLCKTQYGSDIFKELGPACDGPMECFCRCKKCRPTIEVKEEKPTDVNKLIAEVKAKRRFK